VPILPGFGRIKNSWIESRPFRFTDGGGVYVPRRSPVEGPETFSSPGTTMPPVMRVPFTNSWRT